MGGNATQHPLSLALLFMLNTAYGQSFPVAMCKKKSNFLVFEPVCILNSLKFELISIRKR